MRQCVPMNEAVFLEAPAGLARLRRSCSLCSLQQLCLPSGLDAESLAHLERTLRRPRRVRRGEHLYFVGTAQEALFVASSGALKTVSISEGGEAHVVGFHLPGELVGLDGLAGGVHRCEAVALVDSEVCEVQLDRLNAVAREVPGLQAQLLRVIGRSLERDHLHAGLLVRRQAHERLALFLQGLSERYALVGASASELRLPMSRDDIARYLGLALETVSRGLTRMHEDGVIDVRGRRVCIRDPAALSLLAHGGEACEGLSGRQSA